jgi:hypothetical protein
MTTNPKTEPEHKSSDSPDHKAQQKKATWKFMRLHLALSYILIAPVALLTPDSIFTDLPMARDFTDGMASWIPMIDRITAYRHPNTDVLRFVWAYAWAVMPLLLITGFGSSIKYGKIGKQLSFGMEFYHSLLIPFLSIILFIGIWYWPNLSFWKPETLFSALEINYDARRRMFQNQIAAACFVPMLACSVSVIIPAPFFSTIRFFRILSNHQIVK